jgi:CRP-like cAMP-binding protein
MYNLFEAYITSQATLTPDELRMIRSLSLTRKVRRRHFLLREGEICQHKIFVARGLLRSYHVREDGSEHIMRFSPENTWTTEHDSLFGQTPARIHIEALEDSDVVLFTRESLEKIHFAIPEFKAYTNRFLSSALSQTYDRIMMNLSYSSEEKYQDFISTFPDVFNRVPLHMVASYLGVSRETLSRIRHAQAQKE